MPFYRANSEYWYADRVGLFKRLRRWFISTGWESPHWTREGYGYRWKARHTVRLALRARGHRSRAYALYSSLCPLSLLGGRLTFQHFGVNWWSRRCRGWYCLHWGHGKSPHWECYRSHNATPWAADRWYIGAPVDVVKAANEQAERMAADREQRESRSAAIASSNGTR